MDRRVTASMFLVTASYQFVDAGAHLFVPGYVRGGVAATLLFWSLPAAAAFAVGLRDTRRRSGVGSRRELPLSTVIGAVLGQLSTVLLLLTTPALSGLTAADAVPLTAVTAVFVALATVAGSTLALAARGTDWPLTHRHARVAGALFAANFLYAVYAELNAVPVRFASPGDAVFFLLAGVWLFALARTLERNDDGESTGT